MSRKDAPAVDAAIVTGAGRGIGKAVSLRLAQQGAHVICVAKTDSGSRTRDEIVAAGGSAESLACDLADPVETQRRVSALLSGNGYKKMGLVLAAGALGPRGPIHESSLADWQTAYSVNLLGNLAVYNAAMPSMLARGFGRMVFFSGGGSDYAYPEFPAYAAVKTAVVRTVENIHEDLKGRGDFVVVCAAPGAVETDMTKSVREAGAQIKTITDIGLPVEFVSAILAAKTCAFSGRFVHVRDEWKKYLNSDAVLEGASLWKLRRLEPSR
jgi:NAD(P)-dependent dehydrogenase (short-subunit alcohol dehydrogenase family)